MCAQVWPHALLQPRPKCGMSSCPLGSSPYLGGEYKDKGHGFQALCFPPVGLQMGKGGETAPSSLGGSVAQWGGSDLGVGGWSRALLLPSSTSCVPSDKPRASFPQMEVTLQADLVRHRHTGRTEPDCGCENVQSARRGPLPGWF